MKIYYLINDICVCCGATVGEGTMICQQCVDKVEKEDKLRQTEPCKEKKGVQLWNKRKKRIKSRKWPLLIWKDMEKHTVIGSPEMVCRVSSKIDQIVQEIACEKSIVQTIKENV